MANKYAFIGAGNMAKAIIKGMLTHGIKESNIITTTRTKRSGKKLVAEFGVANTQNNNSCLFADVIILSVKPQVLKQVLLGLDKAKLADKLIISVIAGIPCKFYYAHIADNIRLVRAMPNMPSRIQQGITGLYCENCQASDKELANDIMRFIGKTLWVEDENAINYINAISGSGPAYVYSFIYNMAKAGERLGLSYKDALNLALQTTIGSAMLAELENDGSTEFIQTLIEQITSKGGTTFAAMQSLTKDNFANVIDNAVQHCYNRALVLGK